MAEEKHAPRHRVFPIFRASFVLTDRHAFDRAVEICRDWISLKGGGGLQFPDGEPGDFTAPDCKGAVRTVAYEDGRIWAARLEDLRETGAGRNWTTDLFVEARGGSLVRFGAELVLRSSGLDGERFSPSRPRVVRDVLAALSAEADGVPLADSAEAVDEAALDDFIKLLVKENRRLPIVAISRDEIGVTQIDPALAADRLSGASHVRILESGASWELTRRLGKPWSVYNRAVRVYFPGVGEDDDPYRHPLSLISSSRSGDQVLKWLCTRVLPAGFRDADQDARFWRIGLLRQSAPATSDAGVPGETAEDLEILRSERDEARRDAENAEALMYEANRLRADAESERDRIKDELDTIREGLRALPTGTTQEGVGPQEVLPLVKGTLSVADALNLVERLFPGRITVLPSARVSANQSEGFRFPEQALDLLWKLATDYWAKLAGGEGDVEARKVFGRAYAAKESQVLSTNGRRSRTFTWSGEDIFMEKHLKIGRKESDAETFRVHFHWAAEQKRIIVGHCGPHIDF